MTFFSRIKRTFAPQPITLHMMPADESIMVDFRRSNELLDYQALIDDPAGKKLPAQVLGYLSKNIGATSGYYPMPYPYAMQMLRGLRHYTGEDLLFDCEAVEKLRIIPRPTNFALRWGYDPARHSLVRYLIGADHHIGKCWFQQGDTIWALDEKLPEQLQKWLGASSLGDRYVFRFVAEILPACTNAGYPVSCNLRLVDGVTFRLNLLTTRKSLLRVALVCSHPELNVMLSPLDGDEDNLISGVALMHNLRRLLSDRLIEILRAGEVTFMGEQIPTFIQDELRPRATQLHVDMTEIDKLYPIISADHLKPVWHLEETTKRGIGVHWAVSSVVNDGRNIPLLELQALAANQRFYNIDDLWLEFTPAFREKLDLAVRNGRTAFDLTPSELLGGSSERLFRLKLTPPSLPPIQIDSTNSVQEQQAQARALLATLRSYGLPAGISGLQVDMPRLLADMCLKLLTNYDDFVILWVVGKKRKDTIQQTLLDALKAYNGPIRSERISVLSPDQLNQSIAETDWALVIFQDLDQIVPSANFARAYQLIRRLWAVATFTNRRWHENPALQEKVLQAMRLTTENASAFLATCHYSFSDQQETLISRIASPFKRLLVDAPDDVHAAPIPPRVAPTAPRTESFEIRPYARPSPKSGSVVYESPGDRFVQEAQRLVDRTAPPTEPVPFMQYYPTYSGMSPEQLRWYLYWRDQFRHGNAISTDLSYLFVHIYEGLNLIGFDNALDAFQHLVSLWTHYRALQPKLDRYLVDWLADFVVVHRLPMDPLDWYANALLIGNTGGDADLAFTAWVYRYRRRYVTFPLELLYRIIGYSPKNNKFYRENNGGSAVDNAFVKGIRVIDEWLFQSNNIGLFEQDGPTTTEEVTRPPFAGAVHRYGNTPIRIAEVRRWSAAELLARDVTGILKYVENILREQAGFGSKLRGITIPQAWKTVLDQAFGVVQPVQAPAKRRGRPRKAQASQSETGGQIERQEIVGGGRVSPSIEVESIPEAPEYREIVIDTDALARLTQETEEMRARLLEDAEPEHDDSQQPSPEPESLIETASPSLPASYTERPTDAPPGLLTDLPEVAVAMGTSNDTGAKLLRLLREHDWQAKPDLLETAIENGFLSLHLDTINERAFEQFNDALIFQEDGLWVVAEDYRDEIGYILDHPAYEMSGSKPSSPPPNVETQAPAYAELSEEWALFAQQLQPHHWEVIAALLSPADVTVRLDAIARSVYTTSNLLVDAINDAAMDTIGDIVIDTLPDPPRIEDEDFDALTQMLTWATANQLLEL